MRGTASLSHRIFRNMRITPAYAGNRSAIIKESGENADHPRVCGEQTSRACPGALSRGSPPRMRGTAGKGEEGTQGTGITPAYAGNRYAKSFGMTSIRDHPRVCGEQMLSFLSLSTDVGSPPRMRGTDAYMPHF